MELTQKDKKYITKQIAKKDSIKKMADEVLTLSSIDELKKMSPIFLRMAKVHLQMFGFYTYNDNGKKCFIEVVK